MSKYKYSPIWTCDFGDSKSQLYHKTCLKELCYGDEQPLANDKNHSLHALILRLLTAYYPDGTDLLQFGQIRIHFQNSLLWGKQLLSVSLYLFQSLPWGKLMSKVFTVHYLYIYDNNWSSRTRGMFSIIPTLHFMRLGTFRSEAVWRFGPLLDSSHCVEMNMARDASKTPHWNWMMGMLVRRYNIWSPGHSSTSNL